jgi:hypothetical protein
MDIKLAFTRLLLKETLAGQKQREQLAVRS